MIIEKLLFHFFDVLHEVVVVNLHLLRVVVVLRVYSGEFTDYFTASWSPNLISAHLRRLSWLRCSILILFNVFCTFALQVNIFLLGVVLILRFYSLTDCHWSPLSLNRIFGPHFAWINNICSSSIHYWMLCIHLAIPFRFFSLLIYFKFSFSIFFFRFDFLLIIVFRNIDLDDVFISPWKHHLSCSLIFPTHRAIIAPIFQLFYSICVS